MPVTKTVAASVLRTKIESLFEAMNAHDVGKIVDLHTRDAVWVDPMVPEPLAGKAAIRARLRDMFTTFPDLHFPAEDIDIIVAEDGKKVVATYTLMATMTGPMAGFAPTGKAVRLQGVCIYEFRGEHIARHTVVYDSMATAQALGLLPSTTGLPMRVYTNVQRIATGAMKLVRR